ncbi:MAG: hypothetical protein EOM54_14450 [Clostridia bacterium]|nr:hypothetical protein [Clostridia bacterium]NCC66574.1 hypothetical protein [Clostridia bacterium]
MLGTKKKLMTAVAMLVISVIMLTTASFAWFTISTNPEITAMTTQVVVNENLEIALAETGYDNAVATTLNDTGNAYTWGNQIDLSKVAAYMGSTSPAVTALSKIVAPATIDSVIKYPVYGEDGRPTGTLTAVNFSTMGDGFGTFYDTAAGQQYGYYVDFLVRTNVGGDLILQEGEANRANGDATTLGGGSYIESANSVLAHNLYVAFDISAAGATAIDNSGLVKATSTTGTPGTAGNFRDTFAINETTYATGIGTLEANSTYVVRMYVYLEGAGVTNKDASIDASKINGALNVQFAIDGVDNPMDQDTVALS